jgi:hypothetical protein
MSSGLRAAAAPPLPAAVVCANVLAAPCTPAERAATLHALQALSCVDKACRCAVLGALTRLAPSHWEVLSLARRFPCAATLNLSRVRRACAAEGAVAPWNSVTRVDVSCVELSFDALSRLVAACPNVQHLNLARCRLRGAVAPPGDATEELRAEATADAGGALAQALAPCARTLRSLTLDDTCVSATSLVALLPQMASLTALSVANCRHISGAALAEQQLDEEQAALCAALAALAAHGALRTLDVSSTCLVSGGAPARNALLRRSDVLHAQFTRALLPLRATLRQLRVSDVQPGFVTHLERLLGGGAGATPVVTCVHPHPRYAHAGEPPSFTRSYTCAMHDDNDEEEEEEEEQGRLPYDTSVDSAALAALSHLPLADAPPAIAACSWLALLCFLELVVARSMAVSVFSVESYEQRVRGVALMGTTAGFAAYASRTHSRCDLRLVALARTPPPAGGGGAAWRVVASEEEAAAGAHALPASSPLLRAYWVEREPGSVENDGDDEAYDAAEVAAILVAAARECLSRDDCSSTFACLALAPPAAPLGEERTWEEEEDDTMAGDAAAVAELLRDLAAQADAARRRCARAACVLALADPPGGPL